MPAEAIMILSHLAIVQGLTGLWGLTQANKNDVWNAEIPSAA